MCRSLELSQWLSPIPRKGSRTVTSFPVLTVLCPQGVRAVISQNQPVPPELKEEGDRYQETYLHYADRGPEAAGFSQYPGDARAALAPFLAARHVGMDNFKWVLFGDGKHDMLNNWLSACILWRLPAGIASVAPEAVMFDNLM